MLARFHVPPPDSEIDQPEDAFATICCNWLQNNDLSNQQERRFWGYLGVVGDDTATIQPHQICDLVLARNGDRRSVAYAPGERVGGTPVSLVGIPPCLSVGALSGVGVAAIVPGSYAAALEREEGMLHRGDTLSRSESELLVMRGCPASWQRKSASQVRFDSAVGVVRRRTRGCRILLCVASPSFAEPHAEAYLFFPAWEFAPAPMQRSIAQSEYRTTPQVSQWLCRLTISLTPENHEVSDHCWTV
jgi:hypothetical protein